MSMVQKGILDPLPQAGRYLFFSLQPNVGTQSLRQTIEQLPTTAGDAVIGLGESLIQALDGKAEGLHPFPAMVNQGIDVPSTPFSLWCWLRGDDPGELMHRGRAVEQHLEEGLDLVDVVDAFCHDGGRDLSGYEDGTENPEGEEAIQAAVVHQPPSLAGSSFVAVQQWLHNFNDFDAMTANEQDDCIGRHKDTNEEYDAPASAHVKRTAQEDFSPEAFVIRRSMPWTEAENCGLMFVAFGHSLYAFEAQMKRMVGLDDGIIDGLFKFTRPISGCYFWCPPIKGQALDLSGLFAA